MVEDMDVISLFVKNPESSETPNVTQMNNT